MARDDCYSLTEEERKHLSTFYRLYRNQQKLLRLFDIDLHRVEERPKIPCYYYKRLYKKVYGERVQKRDYRLTEEEEKERRACFDELLKFISELKYNRGWTYVTYCNKLKTWVDSALKDGIITADFGKVIFSDIKRFYKEI